MNHPIKSEPVYRVAFAKPPERPTGGATVFLREQDPRGYWTPRRLEIWHAMTPEQRDFDRYQGMYPPGQSYCETREGQEAIDQRADDIEYERHACTCHRNPPCSHCTDCTECGES